MVITVKDKNCHGWTLIEILIVVFIIGIAATFVTLSVGNRGRDQQVEKIAQRLTQVISLAQTQALVQSTTLGLRIKPEGYEFLEFNFNQQTNQQDWVPIKETTLRFHALPANVEVQLKTQEDTIEEASPQLVISSNGETPPFEINVGPKGKLASYQIIGDANGSIKIIKSHSST